MMKMKEVKRNKNFFEKKTKSSSLKFENQKKKHRYDTTRKRRKLSEKDLG
jgi:hypothetical protein